MSDSESNQGEYINYDTPNKITVNECGDILREVSARSVGLPM